MAYQINNVSIYDAIQAMYLSLVVRAKIAALETDDISIYIHPIIADELELKDTLTVVSAHGEVNLPIIRDKEIELIRQLDGTYRSSIDLMSPSWIQVI